MKNRLHVRPDWDQHVFTGTPHLQNHFYDGESLGGSVHFNNRNSIWFQDTFNKISTVPWYTTVSVGYTRSW
jgi:hypothetical protein